MLRVVPGLYLNPAYSMVLFNSKRKKSKTIDIVPYTFLAYFKHLKLFLVLNDLHMFEVGKITNISP